MIFEDGSGALEAARLSLAMYGALTGKEPLRADSLPDFLELARNAALTLEERRLILSQATLLIESLFSHLPFKRARYAIDPLQQLRLLDRQVDHLSDLDFHEWLLRIFANLRDVHTNYFLPAPYAAAAAFLPLKVEYFYDEQGRRRFLVAAVMAHFRHDKFTEGAELLRWNGMLMETAIDGVSDIAAGANESARFQRGLDRLTIRPLLASLPPKEDYVLVEYLPKGAPADEEPRAILLPWSVLSNYSNYVDGRQISASVAVPRVLSKSALGCLFGAAERWGKPHPQQRAAGEVAEEAANSEDWPYSRLPDQLEFQFTGGPVDGPLPGGHLMLAEASRKQFAWLRVKDFSVPEDEAGVAGFDRFKGEFRRILRLLNGKARDGLVIDIRGNPGGDIQMAEELLQHLTPRDIEPARFAVLQTAFVQDLVRRLAQRGGEVENKHWRPYLRDLMQASLTGSPLTRAFPLSDLETINDLGQIYQGPVVLLTDGLTYSSGDFFAAGFQDNQIGTIIGTQVSTGGGGANRWSHEDLKNHYTDLFGPSDPNPFVTLPGGASMGVALRRGVRAGVNEGCALEDLGVTADVVHQQTLNDLQNFDFDLLQRACRTLAEHDTYHLEAENLTLISTDPPTLQFDLVTSGLVRVEAVFGNARGSFPQRGIAVIDGRQTLELPMAGLPPVVTYLQLRGYTRLQRSLGLAAESKRSLLALEPQSPQTKVAVPAS